MNDVILHQLFSKQDYNKLVEAMAQKDSKMRDFDKVLEKSKAQIDRFSQKVKDLYSDLEEQSLDNSM